MTHLYKIITLFIIHEIINERLLKLVCGTSSGAGNLILLLQAINPESVLRQGNSLGPEPGGQGEGRQDDSANRALKETQASLPLFLPGGELCAGEESLEERLFITA